MMQEMKRRKRRRRYVLYEKPLSRFCGFAFDLYCKNARTRNIARRPFFLRALI